MARESNSDCSGFPASGTNRYGRLWPVLSGERGEYELASSILVEGNGWDRYRLASPGYFEDYVRHGFPMGRLGTAEEVADVIVFIASPRAYWINGRNIPVDGLEQPHAPLDRRPY
jgi:Enoyl-(Acyl carrier protein) reductase